MLMDVCVGHLAPHASSDAADSRLASARMLLQATPNIVNGCHGRIALLLVDLMRGPVEEEGLLPEAYLPIGEALESMSSEDGGFGACIQVQEACILGGPHRGPQGILVFFCDAHSLCAQTLAQDFSFRRVLLTLRC